jgi:hypothetical protein
MKGRKKTFSNGALRVPAFAGIGGEESSLCDTTEVLIEVRSTAGGD